MNRQALKDVRYDTIGHIDTVSDGKQPGKNALFHVTGSGNLLAALTDEAAVPPARSDRRQCQADGASSSLKPK
jgi:hypothetical protein